MLGHRGRSGGRRQKGEERMSWEDFAEFMTIYKIAVEWDTPYFHSIYLKYRDSLDIDTCLVDVPDMEHELNLKLSQNVRVFHRAEGKRICCRFCDYARAFTSNHELNWDWLREHVENVHGYEIAAMLDLYRGRVWVPDLYLSKQRRIDCMHVEHLMLIYQHLPVEGLTGPVCQRCGLVFTKFSLPERNCFGEKKVVAYAG